MTKVTGIGGVFLRAKDPAGMALWYARHLGVPLEEDGNAMLRWRADPDPDAMTVWATFDPDSGYFGRLDQQVMINYRVGDLTALLDELKADGIDTVKPREDHPYGSFAWIDDPEGNRLELWEPPKGA